MLVDHRNIGAAFRRLSLPAAIAMLGDQLLGIADTIAIGSLGPVALAGATAAGTCSVALTFGVIGFMGGCGIIAAQRIGKQDLDGFGSAVRAGVLMPVVAAVLGSALGAAFAGTIIAHMVGALPSAHASAQYLAIRCLSMIPIAISGTLITGLGAAGNRSFGVLMLLLINLIHIPLLLVLALGLGTHHPFGIPGAAVSSLLSECIACVYGIWYVWRRPEYRVFARLSVDVRLALECARLGLPEAVFLFAMMVPDAIIVTLLAPLGAVLVSGFRALIVVSDLTFAVPAPLQGAVQTVIGQRLGARDVAGAKAFFVRARRQSLWITAVAAIAAALLAWPAAYLFTFNAAVASIAAWPLAAHMLTLPLKAWAMVSMAPIRAAGDTRFSLLIGVVTAMLVIPAAYLCIRVLHMGLWSVPVAWIFAWSARSAITAIKLHGESWSRRPVHY